MHGQGYVSSTVINNLIVTDVHDQNPVEVPKLYTREFIPVEHKQIPTRELLTNWKHLEEVSEEIASYNPDSNTIVLLPWNHNVLYRAKEMDLSQFAYVMDGLLMDLFKWITRIPPILPP
jgi:hypothetical protein